MTQSNLPVGRRPKILLLAPFLYGEKAANGGGVLCWAQLKQLTQDAELAFLSFSGIDAGATERQHQASLAQHCTSVSTVPLNVRKINVALGRLASLLLGPPELGTLCHTKAMVQALARVLHEFQPDLVWIQFPQMAQYVAYCHGLPCVMDVQDAFTLSCFRQAQRFKGLAAVRYWMDWVSWSRYEAQHYAHFKAAITLSEQDAQVLRAMNPAVNAISMGLPLGQSRQSAVACEPMRVGFAGSFGHRPNAQGVAWFIRDVWPLVLARLPKARFVVAGGNPPEALVAAQTTGIEFAGFVPDIFDFYAANSVTVVPLLSGGGVKIKTVEAMLAGSAVVSTRIGIEGTSAVHSTHALVADDAIEFATSIVQVLQTPALQERLRFAALQHAQILFSSQAWRARVNALLQQIGTERYGH
jgi:polysaccharide biosynthesis protein PslH